MKVIDCFFLCRRQLILLCHKDQLTYLALLIGSLAIAMVMADIVIAAQRADQTSLTHIIDVCIGARCGNVAYPFHLGANC